MHAKAQHTDQADRRLGRRMLPFLLSTLMIGGCATQQPAGLGPNYDPAAAALAAAGVTPIGRLTAGQMILDEQGTEIGPDTAPHPTIVRGNDQMFRLPAARAPVVIEGGAVSLNFEQAPVADVVHAVLGDILQVPYVINEPISGNLTVNTHAPLPREQIFSVFESVLLANGLAVVSDASGVYHVGRPEALRGIAPILGRVGALAPGQSMVIVPLRYIGAVEMAEILKPLAPNEGLVRVDPVRNLIMLAGSRNQIEGWLDVVSSFDVDLLKGMSVGLFPLQHNSVDEVKVALGAVFGSAAAGAGSSTAVSGAAGSRGVPGAAADSPATELNISGGPLGSLVRIVAIERLNALLVVSPRAHFIDQAREWIERFDTPQESGLEPGIYVYPVQNGTASHLAGLMSALFAGELNPAKGSATRTDPGVAPGLRTASTGTTGSVNATTSSGSSSSSSSTGSSSLGTNNGDAPQAITQFELGPQVRVIADEYNNALLIYAPRKEYRKIEAALRQLDKSPTQVLVEASIIEVTLRDELQYGLQWFFQGGLGGGSHGEGTLSSGNGFNPLVPRGTGAPGEGFSYSIFNGSGQLRVLLNLLARKSLLNVISSPSVMVLDNHTAHIQVGDQQPIRSSTSTTDGGVVTSSIQYRDTGVLLSVTPSVNAGGMVSMTIEQEVTDVGDVDTGATDQRTFLQRKISSRVAVRSGETVVLGGLIRDNTTNGKAGLPVLHDVPLFGHLFGSTKKEQVRTELLVMLTPRVMQNEAELQQVGLEMRQRMQGLQQMLIRSNYQPEVERTELPESESDGQ